MITFKQPLKNLSPWVSPLPQGLLDLEIQNICFDSREVNNGDAFFVLPSVNGNEHVYIETAIDSGSKLLIVDQQLSVSVPSNIHVIQVDDAQEVAGQLIAGLLYKQALPLKILGITGTNGKSSISFYLAQLLNELNAPCAVMGTLGYGDWQQLKPTGMTTLPLERLHFALNDLAHNYESVAMEVSSHGLEQNRMAGVHFLGAVFSNLTRDHLDYHGTMEAYGAAKALLFKRPELTFAVINADDDFAKILMAQSVVKPVTFGLHADADLQFKILSHHSTGLTVQFKWEDKTELIELPLFGAFNAENVAAAFLTCLQMNFEFEAIAKACRVLVPVPGRMQKIKAKDTQPLVIVDYAHTPDALEQILKSIRMHVQTGQLSLVVGCGGDRDQGKRPLMGKIACQFADKVFITSDNPRSESPEKICQQMVANIENDFVIEVDRQKAIQSAIGQASVNDVVVIAGKGHEDYQEINGQRFYFSDVDEAKKVLQLGMQS